MKVVALSVPQLAGARKDVAGASETAVLLLEQNPDSLPAPAVRPGDLVKADLRNVLSRAYLPRARACYLLRQVEKPGDRELSGRLRIELQLERGELTDAVVTQSTLGRPDIEACLREAAFAVEIPRAAANDASIRAALNLVFQPQTRTQAAVPSAVSEDIDLIIGPLPTSDPLHLIEPSDGAR